MTGVGLKQKDKNLTITKTREEILAMFEEIKTFEKKFCSHEIIDNNEEEFIEFEPVFLEVFEPEPPEPEFDTVAISEKEKKIKIKEKSAKVKTVDPTTFKIRFDGNGQLVNLELKKPKLKAKKESKLNSKLGSKLKKVRRRKKDKTEASDTKIEETSKASKLKSGIGKIGKIKNIGKLKNVIPRRGKKKETVEEKPVNGEE